MYKNIFHFLKRIKLIYLPVLEQSIYSAYILLIKTYSLHKHLYINAPKYVYVEECIIDILITAERCIYLLKSTSNNGYILSFPQWLTWIYLTSVTIIKLYDQKINTKNILRNVTHVYRAINRCCAMSPSSWSSSTRGDCNWTHVRGSFQRFM